MYNSFNFMHFSMGGFIIGIIIILVLFLLFRNFQLIFGSWKINEIVSLLKEIRDNLKKKSEEENNQPR